MHVLEHGFLGVVKRGVVVVVVVFVDVDVDVNDEVAVLVDLDVLGMDGEAVSTDGVTDGLPLGTKGEAVPVASNADEPDVEAVPVDGIPDELSLGTEDEAVPVASNADEPDVEAVPVDGIPDELPLEILVVLADAVVFSSWQGESHSSSHSLDEDSHSSWHL